MRTRILLLSYLAAAFACAAPASAQYVAARSQPGTPSDAADKKPFEQGHAGCEEEDERRTDERRCRQVQQRMFVEVDLGQNGHTRHERAEGEDRDDEGERSVERRGGSATERAALRT